MFVVIVCNTLAMAVYVADIANNPAVLDFQRA
jgi:hypothetical protein